jgi:hypothetical protein
METHAPCRHGAVPSAKASRTEVNVTDAALNPAGTAAAGGREADRDARSEEAAERVGERAADGACAVPHPDASATISSPPHAIAHDLFIELAS